ncbi:outer membrane protein assembly factor BamB family protein [Streptomyces zagrosensis]|uniref:Outer membrane protein assembly factor BamB n=1 Tax=Streptomyces zagrosensis TaxID=1042984 RepID=A0A7W9Q9J7_9ACTN|nr:PQQ-binding-like beta-propeller repeat protein [Streptomyces zagrosensis]MBB5936146.1 outer membrane protein assembly factor BamB [Streptomyces zagrosensis]
MVKGSAYLVARASSGGQWHLLAFDLRTGRQRWREPVAEPEDARRPPMLCGAVRGDQLLLCRGLPDTDMFELSAHALADGQKRWSLHESSEGAPPSQLAHDERHLYLTGTSLQAYRLSDGGSEWLFGEPRDVGSSAGETRLYGAPTVRDGVVYCSEGDRGVVAVDAITGSINWLEKDLKGRSLNREVPPVVGAKYVYSLDDKGLRAVDLRTRRAVWTFETDATVLTADHQRGRLYARELRQTFALPLA